MHAFHHAYITMCMHMMHTSSSTHKHPCITYIHMHTEENTPSHLCVSYCVQAIQAYSSALLAGTDMPALRIRCHANRAHAHVERRNYGYAYQDSMRAVNLSEAILCAEHAPGVETCTCKHVPVYEADPACAPNASTRAWINGVIKKSLGRAAKACVALEKWADALSLCDRGLDVEAEFGDETLRSIREQARLGYEAEMRLKRKKEEEEERKKLKLITVKVCLIRRLSLKKRNT
jgi:hypothetical protein